ncbi:hypothetical protein [Burkholderia gladioli]|uniref:hypothetical protein n=1 Tax=Burkholderia gladioli TaxID=28095 RepID=UPI002856C269|nr:hypothetical protein [Burkholderia gladioli]MDR8091081.1 hypothetical protein [Burkholderia gladioli]
MALINHIQTPDGDNVVLNDDSGYVIAMTYTINPYAAITYPNTNIQQMAPPWLSYPFYQYRTDPNIRAFTDAYNGIAQDYLDWFNSINLPIYAGNPQITGAGLDYVLTNLYGIKRSVLPAAMIADKGPYDSTAYNTIEYNNYTKRQVEETFTTTDDVYKRIATWNLYKGDGYTFTIPWLKRRIQRFLTGNDGVDGANESGLGAGVDQANAVSVQFTQRRHVTITVDTSSGTDYAWRVLKSAIQGGVCQLPIGIAFTLV